MVSSPLPCSPPHSHALLPTLMLSSPLPCLAGWCGPEGACYGQQGVQRFPCTSVIICIQYVSLLHPHTSSILTPPSSHLLHPHTSILTPPSSHLHPHTSILTPPSSTSSILTPPSSPPTSHLLHPHTSILTPPSSSHLLHPHTSTLNLLQPHTSILTPSPSSHFQPHTSNLTPPSSHLLHPHTSILTPPSSHLLHPHTSILTPPSSPPPTSHLLHPHPPPSSHLSIQTPPSSHPSHPPPSSHPSHPPPSHHTSSPPSNLTASPLSLTPLFSFPYHYLAFTFTCPTKASHSNPPLQEGDQIIYINGKSVCDCTHDEVILMIRQPTLCRPPGPLTLVIKPCDLNRVNPIIRVEDTDILGTTADPGLQLRRSLTELKESLLTKKLLPEFDVSFVLCV